MILMFKDFLNLKNEKFLISIISKFITKEAESGARQESVVRRVFPNLLILL